MSEEPNAQEQLVIGCGLLLLVAVVGFLAGILACYYLVKVCHG